MSNTFFQERRKFFWERLRPPWLRAWGSVRFRAGLRGGNGGNCPGPSAPRGPSWWHSFVLNKIFVWKIVVIQKRYSITNTILRRYVEYHWWFLCNWLSASFSRLISTEYKYFRFCSIQWIWILLVTFPNNDSFGMGLSTLASRLLHKCRENDTSCLIAAVLVLLRLLFSISDSVTSCAVWR